MNTNICEICSVAEVSVSYRYGVVTCEACKVIFYTFLNYYFIFMLKNIFILEIFSKK